MKPGFTLERDQWRQLVLTDDEGNRHSGVEPVRAFPLTDPRHHISLCDAQGREILEVASLDELPEALRTLLEEELAQREFVPLILRILNTPPETEPAQWKVETDRGVTTFELDTEDNVHRLGKRQVSIVDSQGIRYLIADTRKLDSHSRHVLDRFLTSGE